MYPASFAEQINAWTCDVSQVATTATASDASGVVHEFLTGAGQTALLNQHQASETAFTKGVEQMRQDVQTCVLLLGQYSTMYGLYPASARGGHRTVKCIQWMKSIGDSFDVETCQEVQAEFSALFEAAGSSSSSTDSSRMRQHHVFNVHFQMESWGQQLNMRLQTVYDQMMADSMSGLASSSPVDRLAELRSGLGADGNGTQDQFTAVVARKLCQMMKRQVTTVFFFCFFLLLCFSTMACKRRKRWPCNFSRIT